MRHRPYAKPWSLLRTLCEPYCTSHRSMIRLPAHDWSVWSCSMISFPSFVFPVQYISFADFDLKSENRKINDH